DKCVWGGGGAVLLRSLLIFAIVEVRVIIALVLVAYFHLFEAVVQIGIAQFIQPYGCIRIGADGHYLHTFGRIGIRKRDDAVFISLRGRAMVAGKDDDQQLGILETC